MTVTLSPPMFLQFFNPNNSGAPAAGYLLFTYAAGTSTKQPTWVDSTQLVQNTNPIVLDPNGAAYVWGDPTMVYKYALCPPNDTDPPTSILRSEDNIQFPITLSTFSQAFIGQTIYPQTAAEIAAGVVPTSYAYPELNVLRYGAPTNGSNAAPAIQQAILVLAQYTNGELVIPSGFYFSVSQVTFSALTGFRVRCDGTIVSIASQPGTAFVDERSTFAGQFSPLKFTSCTNFKIYGKGSIQNGFVEPLFLASCTDFDVSLDCRGNGTNSTLCGVYVRFCNQFVIHDMVMDSVTAQAMNDTTEVFYQWLNSIQVWDSTDFVIRGVISRKGGMNGFYIGSNCFDFEIADNISEFNSGSGMQFAWSSFGVFPQRFSVLNNITRYNQADGLDFNNSSPVAVNLDATICENVHIFNGWINCNPANAAGNDGSGIGTFIAVNQFTAADNVVYECARAGVYLLNCNQWTVSGNTILKSTVGTQSIGAYFESCNNFSFLTNVVNTPSLEAVKVAGTLVNGTWDDNYLNGAVSFPTPGVGATYQGLSFAGNKIFNSIGIQVTCDWRNCSVTYAGTATALTLLADNISVENVRVISQGAGTIAMTGTGLNGVKVIGCNFVAASQALILNGCVSSLVHGNYFQSAAAATMQLIGVCSKTMLMCNRVNNTGGANSIFVAVSCSSTSTVGNTYIAGSPAYGGTYEVNFP